jgi:hypothetical protein
MRHGRDELPRLKIKSFHSVDSEFKMETCRSFRE